MNMKITIYLHSTPSHPLIKL